MAKRCGAINMTQAAAKEVLKGLEGEKRVGSLMGWTTTTKESAAGFFLMLLRSYICVRRDSSEESGKRRRDGK